MYRELAQYREALTTYITSTYHISDPTLVQLRLELLRMPGAIAQPPFIESTPRYEASPQRRYESLRGVPPRVKEFLGWLGSADGGRRLYDPPYSHQADAIEAVFSKPPKDLVVTTGTGSGKTETFLAPILSLAAAEADMQPERFQERAIRALLLYPMNALVNDQLGRLRTLMGSPEVAGWFEEHAGRPLKFARYTGKALYPGAREEDTDKHSERLRGLKFYRDLEAQAEGTDPARRAEARDLIRALRRRGKWPAKVASAVGREDGMRSWYGTGPYRSDPDTWRRTIERPGDPELLIRHESQEACPDILVTNYSMLEYMLLRPIERGIFRETREFYARHREARLTLVLDEAHLYRGAQGTEVAMLVRRLFQRLRLAPEQVQVICTSASFTDPELARSFAAGLSGKSVEGFVVLSGTKVPHRPSGPGDLPTAEGLSAVALDRVRQASSLRERVEALRPLLAAADELRGYRYRVRLRGEGAHAIQLEGLRPDLTWSSEAVLVADGGEALTAEAYLLVASAGLVTNAVEVAPDGIAIDDDEIRARPEVTFREGTAQVGEDRDPLARLAFDALQRLPVTGRLLNLTSGATTDEDPERDPPGVGSAQPIEQLAGRLFPRVPEPTGRTATDALVELASMARAVPGAPPLLAARAHAFFRALPGLWACSDVDCAELPDTLRGGPTGRLFAQPVRVCGCGARVFELLTCRSCGGAYLRAYAAEPARPEYLWAEDVGRVDDLGEVVSRVYIALQEPAVGVQARAADLETRTGRLYTDRTVPEGGRPREVWLPRLDEQGNDGEGKAGPGKFERCVYCEDAPQANGLNYPIQDHTTEGDEPFQALVGAQLLEQPPRPDLTTPLRGRKVLIFSDGRQAASRLAGRLKQTSLHDSVRPLWLDGLRTLEQRVGAPVSLRHSYVAILAACATRGVQLRPAEAPHFVADLRRVRALLDSTVTLGDLEDLSAQLDHPNEALMGAAYKVLNHRHTGYGALALARVEPLLSERDQQRLSMLPAPHIAGVSDEAEARRLLLEHWVYTACSHNSVLLPTTPIDWIDSNQSDSGPPITIRRTSGAFDSELADVVSTRWFNANLKATKSGAARPWVDFVRSTFAKQETANGFLVEAGRLRLVRSDADWGRCARCRAAQPLMRLANGLCVVRRGNRRCRGRVVPLDPTAEQVFRARKVHYRQLVERLEREGTSGYAPHPFIAEEHSAALGDGGQSSAMGVAEWHELRFQDLDVEGPNRPREGPIDVLSCTTTMEVGIDIGSLNAVALRNVPPGRANYQQRAGRSGRRGSALSTVITYCNVDSHDQRFFRDARAMVSGPVRDPILNLDNLEIVRRHLYALILSEYQQRAVPDWAGKGEGASVFESLGPLERFRTGDEETFSFRGLERWLVEQQAELEAALRRLIPRELHGQMEDVDEFVRTLPAALLTRLTEVGAGATDAAPAVSAAARERLARETTPDLLRLDFDDEPSDRSPPPRAVGAPGDGEDGPAAGTASDPDAPLDQRKLLDRLFDTGVLPRYAFPTDVVSFNVFSPASDRWRVDLRYTPQQGLNQALSGYAPGREVWVNGVRHYSFAIWSLMRRDVRRAYEGHQLYFECTICGHGALESQEGARVETVRDCPACGERGRLGPAIRWMRPPGFAHPFDRRPELPLDDKPRVTRPTRAKLIANFTERLGSREQHFAPGGAGVEVWSSTQKLLVTNAGSNDAGAPGFLYCVWCGRAEPNGWAAGTLRSGQHVKPYPNYGNTGPACKGYVDTIALGNEVRTDVALFRFRLSEPCALRPGSVVAQIALTTVANALSLAAAEMLDIEPTDVRGEYRVSMTDGGRAGREVEVFLYDLAAGGAGFVKAAAARTKELLTSARGLLESCSCTHACYDCGLLSYQNRFDHPYLNRHLGAALLAHCLEGTRPEVPAEVEDRLLDAIRTELGDLNEPASLGLGFLHLPGRSRTVVLSHPFCPTLPGSPRASAAAASASGEVTCISQLTADRALPAAVLTALRGAASAPDEELPPSFTPGDIPVVALVEAGRGPAAAAPRARVSLPLRGTPPAGCFVAKLDVETLEAQTGEGRRPFVPGSWAVFVPCAPDAFDDRRPTLLRSQVTAFGATGDTWTLGFPRLRDRTDPPMVVVKYKSRSPRCRQQAMPRSEVVAVAQLWGVLQDGQVRALWG